MRPLLAATVVLVSVTGGCNLVLGIPDRTLDPNLTCEGGACVCSAGFADCDGKIQNGCEADLATDATNCGGCGNECQNGTCNAGACACDADFADCDGKPDNGCEAPLDTDPNNCGTCGHGCLGGACSAKLCQPKQIGTLDDVNYLELASGTLYLGLNAPTATPLVAQPLAGAAVSAAYVPSAKVNGVSGNTFVVTPSAIVWSEGDLKSNNLFSSLLGSTSTPPLVLAANTLALAIATTPDLVYWVDGMTLQRVSTAGGASTVVYGDATTSLNSTVATDATYAYFSDGSAVYAVPHASTTKSTFATVSSVFVMTIYGGTLYLGLNPGFASVPLGGGSPTMLSTTGAAQSIAVDETGVYWTDGSDSTLDVIPLSGGPPRALAKGQMFATSNGLALDAHAVYWVSNNMVFQVAK